MQKSRSSSHKKYPRPPSQSHSEVVWGINPVIEALRVCPQAIREITVDKDKSGQRIEQIIELAQSKAVPVNIVQHRHSAGSAKHGRHDEVESAQGVSARIVLPTLTLEELLDKLADIPQAPLLLALDSIQDPHNLGAIIRSAVAAGANGIILPKDRSAPITATVIKTSAGAVFHAHICRVTNLVNSFRLLKKNGIWIFGATKEAAQSIYDSDLTIPACLVIGSEGKGLRPLVAEQCDFNITIPMQGSLDSLNASVAAGIILFEVMRQRRAQLS